MPVTAGWNEELGAKRRERQWANDLSSETRHSQGQTAPGGPQNHAAHKQASWRAAFAIVKLSTK